MLLLIPLDVENILIEFLDNVGDDPGGVDIVRTDDCEEYLDFEGESEDDSEDESDDESVEESLEDELIKST